MSFNDETRRALARMVAACRQKLKDDVTDQLRGTFGLHRDGTILPLEQLTHLTEAQQVTAQALRELLDHFTANAAGEEQGRGKTAYERMGLEISFTILNRLAALRLCEERGLVIECVGKEMASDGFRLFEMLSRGALGTRYETYRLFLESLFDELAVDLGVLFDRTTPQSAIFPSEHCLEEVLTLLNDPSLTHLWTQDETIGWIYQYFNRPEERKAMRNASSAPRNSRELAVRNQFFTPRYVVEFLTDNTLGRLWYEMRKGETCLKEDCLYLVRRPDEILPQREKKDPRDIKVLDPACGSGHFLLYCFDLFEVIYEEAYEDPDIGPALKSEYSTLTDLKKAVPDLILRHNLHGIDIDLCATQIAALALWLRTQRTYQQLGLKGTERLKITKSNIVCAEPMPGESEMLQEFTASLTPKVLGQLVEEVFERMKLAGEAGSLLKIEEEIRDTIVAARKQWLEGPKYEQIALFPQENRPKQEQLRLFDVSEITDEEFWEQAEERIIEALQAYAETAENGKSFQRRLFADDAAQGFAFVDICRKRFDVVLMNPPFGEFSKHYKNEARLDYSNTYNDIFGAFIECFLERLYNRGLLGAITSRTGFFLTSFVHWRKEVLLKRAALHQLADLGAEVMDDAMVEAAAYCLERTNPTGMALFFRILDRKGDEKQRGLSEAIVDFREGRDSRITFRADLRDFQILPDSPFVYWVPRSIQRKLAEHPQLEPAFADVRQGLATGDDPQFIRVLWEVRPADILFCYYPANGQLSCLLDDPIVRAFFARRHVGKQKWAFHVKAGASQPWFSPITVTVDWENDGYGLRRFTDENGKLKSRPQNILYYFRPGFSWTRRAVRFIPYAIPTGCISTVSRYMAFPTLGEVFVALGVTASNCASAFLRFYGEKFEWPNFLVENLKALPWPLVSDELRSHLESLAKAEVSSRRRAYQNHEPFQEFTAPTLLFPTEQDALAYDARSLLGQGLELEVANAYGLNESELAVLERDLQEALAIRRSSGNSAENESEEADDERDFVLSTDPRSIQDALFSYVVGCLFGRWDIRIGKDPSLAAKLPGPFEPLPVCPPGMLVGLDGLPAKPNGIVSEEWLRARPSANTLPPDGAVVEPTIKDDEYPVRISWDGILVNDPGFDGTRPHPNDIVRRVQGVLELLWGGRTGAIEQEACEILEVRDLREYFGRPAGFFDDHLKRYSKSRRKAPIYWPLSTASGSYTVWVYYHRLTDQTLYTIVNRYVEPKIAEIERIVASLEKEIATQSGREASRSRDRWQAARSFLGELQDFRQELLRVAGLPYKPDLNDGVIINAAPLHSLFRHRQWAQDTKSCWEKLERGEYEWAHMAYTIWPQRVREVCRQDRSIAIAHGLEELYEAPEPKAEKKEKRRKNRKDLRIREGAGDLLQ